MKPWYMLAGWLLFATLVGCASQQDVQTLRADLQAMERQRSPREHDLEQRLQVVSDQLGRVEQSQIDSRRELAQTVAATQELRVELQRLRGEVQETRQQMKRGFTATPERETMSTKLAELQTRLETLESRRGAEGSVAPKPPTATPEPLPPASQTAARTTPPVTAAPPPPATRPPAVPPPAAAPPPTTPLAVAPGSNEAEGLFKRAAQEQRNGNHEVAIVLFKQYLRQYPKASSSGQAQYGIGESLYAQKQYEAAIVAFDEVIRKYPNDNRIPAALLKQGYAFAELKDARNARFFLQQVQQKYPNSPEAKQAEEKLKQLQRQG
jgi:tol-pal system protein YbgF